MKKLYGLIFAALIVCTFAGCGTIPDESKVPHEMAVVDLTQKAQEAFDRNNYRGAKAWYQIILKRYGTDISVRTAAEYEIAHILIKQKKWKEADSLLEEILSRYEAQGGMKLPPEFYKLAKIDYAKTRKKIKPKKATVAAQKSAKQENEKEPDTSEPIQVQ